MRSALVFYFFEPQITNLPIFSPARVRFCVRLFVGWRPKFLKKGAPPPFLPLRWPYDHSPSPQRQNKERKQERKPEAAIAFPSRLLGHPSTNATSFLTSLPPSAAIVSSVPDPNPIPRILTRYRVIRSVSRVSERGDLERSVRFFFPSSYSLFLSFIFHF